MLIYFILLALILILILVLNKNKVEHFWDIIPYDLVSNVYKCNSLECIKDESYKCYRWCDRWKEPGGQNNCRKSCLDFADIMTLNDRYNNYTFGNTRGKFDEYSLLANNNNTYF